MVTDLPPLIGPTRAPAQLSNQANKQKNCTETSRVCWTHPHLLEPRASAGPTRVYWNHPRLLEPTASTGTSCVYWNHPRLLDPPASAGPTHVCWNQPHHLLELLVSTGPTRIYWTHPRLLEPTASAGTRHIVYWNYWCLLESLMSAEHLFHSGGVSGLSSLSPKFAHKETEVQPDKSVSGQPSVWGPSVHFKLLCHSGNSKSALV